MFDLFLSYLFYVTTYLQRCACFTSAAATQFFFNSVCSKLSRVSLCFHSVQPIFDPGHKHRHILIYTCIRLLLHRGIFYQAYNRWRTRQSIHRMLVSRTPPHNAPLPLGTLNAPSKQDPFLFGSEPSKFKMDTSHYLSSRHQVYLSVILPPKRLQCVFTQSTAC